MKLKRILSAALAAVTLALAMAVPVSADSIFDTAKNIDSGKKVTKTLDKGKSMDYKITPTEKGTAKVKITTNTTYFDVFVYDPDGNSIEYEYDISTGWKSASQNSFGRNKNSGTFKGTISFDVKAEKTYYIRINRLTYSHDGNKFEASFKYPSEEKAPTALMTMTVKAGDTVQLGANGSSASWSTSKKSVATVSKSGLVTAVKKGKAVITLKCGSKSQNIEIVVE